MILPDSSHCSVDYKQEIKVMRNLITLDHRAPSVILHQHSSSHSVLVSHSTDKCQYLFSEEHSFVVMCLSLDFQGMCSQIH